MNIFKESYDFLVTKSEKVFFSLGTLYKCFSNIVFDFPYTGKAHTIGFAAS